MNQQTSIFGGWPEQYQQSAEQLRPFLCRYGADFYPVGIRGQVRIGWTSGKINRLVGTLNCSRAGLTLSLRVGRNSPLLGIAGPLEADTHPDVGRVRLDSAALPDDLAEWADAALSFTAERFGLTIEELPGAILDDGAECSQAIKEALSLHGWSDPVQVGGPIVTVAMQGEESFYEIRLETEEDPPLLTCLITGPPPLDADGRHRVCEALNRINMTLAFGRFQLDMEDGQLQFMATIPLHDCSAGTETVELLAFFGIDRLDAFLPTIYAVARGDLDPEEAL